MNYDDDIEGCGELRSIFDSESESEIEDQKKAINFNYIRFGNKFFLAVLVIIASLSSLVYCLSVLRDQIKDELELPNSLDKAKKLAMILQTVQQENFYLVIFFFAMLYIVKQTFCIPGSILLNLLAGNMFGFIPGFALVSLLASIGSSCCFLLSHVAGDWVVNRFPSDRLNLMKHKVNQHKQGNNLFCFLLFIRFFPASSWFINLAAPILGIPFLTFFFSCLFGLMPYNFVTVNAGLLLTSTTSTNDFFNATTIMQFLCVGALVSFPVFIKLVQERLNQGLPIETP